MVEIGYFRMSKYLYSLISYRCVREVTAYDVSEQL